ncbi:MAG: alpha/beta hydrolase [Roseicyclus sp.]
MIDWTDAFDNSSYVPGADALPKLWAEMAATWRDAMVKRGQAKCDLDYGPRPRNRFDLFLPDDRPRGLVVFVHGGYWRSMDRKDFSHLAAGARRKGWAVAMPSYTLAPEARVGAIVKEIAAAITAAGERVEGPIRLAGHSAGGHLVARMACAESPLDPETALRVNRVLSISGIHDLRPVLHTAMNSTIRLDATEAVEQSPALQAPRQGLAIHFAVGTAERPELMRQTRLIAEVWARHRTKVTDSYLPGEDHFSIVETLADPESPLIEALLG